MLFNYPSFINEKEQTKSELLYNNIKILIQTHVTEIWYDLNYGTTVRDVIKQGIDDLAISEILEEIRYKLNTYFSNDIIINSLTAKQDIDTLKISLNYTELRTGKQYTINTIEEELSILNNDTSLY